MNRPFFEDLKSIERIYTENPPTSEVTRSKDNLFWRPTSFQALQKEMMIIAKLHQEGQISKDKKILIAGGGDQRRATYLNNVGFDVYSFELNDELLDYSKNITDLLSEEGLVDKGRIKVIKGDFLDDKSYEENNIGFEDFRNIHAYLLPRNLEVLIDKVEDQSPKGTTLFSVSQPGFREIDTKSLVLEDSKLLSKEDLSHIYLDRYKK
ncbi:hypothetical protein GOV05_04175 [Candidatus Woesearchaeota archaeon]|nr:hypothetical protein [Candidatus Woesearchaeota archaeon]